VSNLAIRVLTALVGVPLILGAVYVGGLPFALVVALAAGLGLIEFYRLVRAGGAHPFAPVGLLAGVAVAVAPALTPDAQAAWIGILVAAAFFSGLWFLTPRALLFGLRGWACTLAGVLYVAVLAGHLTLLRSLHNGAWWVVLAFLVTWAYDTGAYFAGSTFGRSPFMHHVSPSKTQEGVAGGLLLSGLAGLAAVPALGLLWWQALLLGILGGAVAQIGDLVESMLKRGAGVKDSGTIIPGHGGVLDRIDGLLFAGALTYYAAAVLGHAV
jgi:phosphatidate cytidylyltransferase